jgi:hypothetical protein
MTDATVGVSALHPLPTEFGAFGENTGEEANAFDDAVRSAEAEASSPKLKR